MIDNLSRSIKEKKSVKRADQYNDPEFSYLKYWDGRQYEHAAEEIAIKRLLNGKHFHLAVDIGGGYGRLSKLLTEYADKVILTDPSNKQLELAKDYLKDYPTIERKIMQADELQFADKSIDLVMMVRVMHHLPDPQAELSEIARVLNDDGYAIIEFANYAHALNRIKHWVRGKRLPFKAIDVRSPENRTNSEIAFVNHNPHTIIRQMMYAGLRVERTLSVSNLRSSKLKKILPKYILLNIEKFSQIPLSKLYFGPSIFFLVKKST
jgi:ubiquinone/menaquinone biosynthesis C-methylase UbiE